MINSDKLEVASTLTDEIDERLVELMQRLANKTPKTDIKDEALNAEVRAVRGH